MSTILIVDDEPEMVLVLDKFFTVKGFKVFIALGGEKALSILGAKKKIDVVLLDMRMPGIKGIEVLETLKKRKILVPVVILTGSINYSHFVEKMILLGFSAKDVFYKPVDLEKLLKHINKRIKANSSKSRIKK